MILHPESEHRGGGRVSHTFGQDFQPLPKYTQYIRTSESWWVITTKRTDPDGSITQSLKIGFKPSY